MSVKIQIKRDTSYNWNLYNPLLTSGQPGYDLGVHRLKVGDGILRWKDLPYVDATKMGAPTIELNSFQKFETGTNDESPFEVNCGGASTVGTYIVNCGSATIGISTHIFNGGNA